ncbi:MAG: ATP-binding protein [Paludibaculum sp.]
MGRKLSDLFPEELGAHFDALRANNQVHQFYKIPLRRDTLAAPALNGNGHNGNGSSNGKAKAERTEVIVNVAIAPLVTKDGARIGRLIIFDDITDREDLERRLVQADKLSSIGLLAAGVAHEVNTPLAVISTYAQMLAKQVHGDEQKSKLLEKIAKQTFRASEIVNSLLNFSRTSTTEYEEMDLNKVIRETLSLMEHQFDKHAIQIEVDLEEGAPLIRGNAGKLQQVFLNLFLNARDAMSNLPTGQARRLSLKTRGEASSIRVEVRDSGAGIPRDLQSRIFDPFFTTKGMQKGTGLGLSVTYGIVEEHGGMIEVESNPGEGALFRLEFPAASRKPVNA